LKKISPALHVANDVLSLIHPRLYENAMQGLVKLRTLPLTMEKASIWTSAYSGISVMTNRRSIPHRDRWGSPPWYDFLLNTGNYEGASLDFPELGLSLRYEAGTGVALCGNILLHKVDYWGSGDRVCYAMFLRKAVLERLESHYVGWSVIDNYTK
jgi:hypothetical protein